MTAKQPVRFPYLHVRRHFLVRLLLDCLVFLLMLIVSQPFLVFPYAFLSLFDSAARDPQTLPPDVQSFFVATDDGKRLEVWHLPAHSAAARHSVAVFFHGNGGGIANFFPYQQWLSSIGISSYGFDYRGYGKSTGWPTEEGVFRDGQAVWRFAANREGLDPAEVIGIGNSIGSGPAARSALFFRARTLVLIAPYTSLPEVARQRPLLGLLSPFLWYSFPTKEYLKSLPGTCLVLAHGRKDTVIRFSHSEELELAYRGTGPVALVVSATAGHNDILFAAYPEIGEKLDKCLTRKETAP